MNDPTTHKTATHKGSAKAECCTESKCETGLRNNYFDGKRLTTDSFRVEQTYMLERRHLLNRAIHGWGVVYGYGVTPARSQSQTDEPGRLKIGAGLALDRCGRELLENGTPIRFKDVIFLNRDGKRVDLDDAFKRGTQADFFWEAPPQEIAEALKKGCWLLSVHYAEEDTAHMRIEERCHCEHDEWDRLCETVRYSVQPIDCDDCCNAFDCELKCECEIGPCCDEPREYTEEEKKQYAAQGRLPPARERHHSYQRGGCKCLCKHLTNLTIGGECGDFCEIEEECRKVRVDLKNGVPLACVKLVTDKCGPVFGTEVEACGPRRLVKRNDLLFDLIRGCDLTRIINYGWKEWHRELLIKDSKPVDKSVPYEEFKNAFGPGGNAGEYITEKFWVQFSRPVRRDTVRPDCFVMTIISSETDDRWWETSRVPIVRVEMPPGDLIERATIVVGGKWLRGAVRSDSTRLQNGPFRVELEVRGDFIVDCNGQTVDANPHGLTKVPTGNGTPGGTFLSTFLVEAAPENPPDHENEDRTKGVS